MNATELRGLVGAGQSDRVEFKREVGGRRVTLWRRPHP